MKNSAIPGWHGGVEVRFREANQKVSFPLIWIIRAEEALTICPAVVEPTELLMEDPPPDPLPIRAPVLIAYW